MKLYAEKDKRIKAAAAVCACTLALNALTGCVLDLSPKDDTSGSESAASESAAQSDEKVSVPGVESLSAETAKDILNDAGLFYEVILEESDQPENTVIMQYPGKGEKIAKNGTVTIVVAKASEKSKAPASQAVNDSDIILVPDFTSQTYEQAKLYFESRGVNVTFTSKYSSEYDYNTIISQSITPNTYLKKGSSISFEVSLGAQAQSSTPAPQPAQKKVASFSGVSDSSHLPNEPGYTYVAENVLNYNGKCWTENKSGVGIGEYVMFSNSTEVMVSACGIVNGYTVDNDRFMKNGRLTKVTFQGDNAADSFTFTISPDSMREQVFDFPRTIRTKNLKIIITDAVSGSSYDDTCISVIIPYQ